MNNRQHLRVALIAGLGLTICAVAPVSAASPHTYASTGTSVSIQKGWNAVPIPVSGIGSVQAVVDSLDQSLGTNAVELVATYHYGRYSVYLPHFSSDLPLQAGDALLVKSAATGAWTPSGTPISRETVSLHTGMNLVTIVPRSSTDTATLAAGTPIKAITIYANGSFHVWTAGAPTFAISEPTAAWVLASSDATWTE